MAVCTQEKNALKGSNPGQTTLETLTIKGFANQDDGAVNEPTACSIYPSWLLSSKICFQRAHQLVTL